MALWQESGLGQQQQTTTPPASLRLPGDTHNDTTGRAKSTAMTVRTEDDSTELPAIGIAGDAAHSPTSMGSTTHTLAQRSTSRSNPSGR